MNLLLLTAWLAAAGPASGRSPSLTASAQLGINGYSSEWGWNYVVLDASNRGDEVTCTLRLPAGRHSDVHYERGLRLPTRSRRRAFLYFPPHTFYYDATCRVTIGDNPKPLVQTNLRALAPAGTTAVAVLGRPVGLKSHLLRLRRDAWRACSLPAENAPDLWIGYSMFHTVVLSNLDPTRMSPRQQRALVGWVRAGGRAVVAGGSVPMWLKATPLGELCPAKGATRRLSDRGALAAWCGARAQVFKDLLCVAPDLTAPEVRVAAGDVPLISRHSLGLGSVDLLAFDPSETTFANWPDRGQFWAKLLDADFEHIAKLGARAGVPFDPKLLTLGTGRSWLSCVMSLAFVVAYIIVAAPLTYVFLRHTKRYSLYAVAMLTVTGLFSLAGHGLCQWQNRFKHVMNTVIFADVPDTWDFMAGVSYFADFRRAAKPVALHVEPADSVVEALDRPYTWLTSWQDAAQPMVLRRGTKGQTISVPEPKWRLYRWRARWVEPFPARAVGEAGLRHAVELMGGELRHCYLLSGDGLYHLGTLKADSLTLPLDRQPWRARPGLRQLRHEDVSQFRMPNDMVGAQRRRLQLIQISFASGHSPYNQTRFGPPRETSRMCPDLSNELGRGTAFLFGWGRASPFHVHSDRDRPTMRHMILARIRVPHSAIAEGME